MMNTSTRMIDGHHGTFLELLKQHLFSKGSDWFHDLKKNSSDLGFGFLG